MGWWAKFSDDAHSLSSCQGTFFSNSVGRPSQRQATSISTQHNPPLSSATNGSSATVLPSSFTQRNNASPGVSGGFLSMPQYHHDAAAAGTSSSKLGRDGTSITRFSLLPPPSTHLDSEINVSEFGIHAEVGYELGSVDGNSGSRANGTHLHAAAAANNTGDTFGLVRTSSYHDELSLANNIRPSSFNNKMGGRWSSASFQQMLNSGAAASAYPSSPPVSLSRGLRQASRLGSHHLHTSQHNNALSQRLAVASSSKGPAEEMTDAAGVGYEVFGSIGGKSRGGGADTVESLALRLIAEEEKPCRRRISEEPDNIPGTLDDSERSTQRETSNRLTNFRGSAVSHRGSILLTAIQNRNASSSIAVSAPEPAAIERAGDVAASESRLSKDVLEGSGRRPLAIKRNQSLGSRIKVSFIEEA